jgi:hypothetical protein
VTGRLSQRLLRLLEHTWVPLLLVSGLLTSMAASVDDANWVEQDRVVLEWLFLVVILGWMLARSRFGGWFVLLYSLLLGFAAAFQIVGNLLPGQALLREGLWVWVDELNLRSVRLGLRIDGWISSFQSGENISDPGLFIFLLSLLVWGSVFWLMWFMLRKRQVLIGLLPLGFLMSVNVNLSRQPLSYYFVFLLFVFLLIAREAFFNRHHDWDTRQIDYPEQLGIEWSMYACLVVLVPG